MPLDKTKPPFALPRLPYEEGALEPVISAKTVSFHHGKHHAAYVDKLNELVTGTPYESLPLEDVVMRAAKEKGASGKAIFNNAGQVWNHNFYWLSMSARPMEPTGRIRDAIGSSFGGVEEFKNAFAKAAVAQFGSGWAWLVKGKNGKLKITTTSNADTPIARGEVPLLTCDVWEHAYYLDYQNRRPDHVKAWLDKLANWSFADQNM